MANSPNSKSKSTLPISILSKVAGGHVPLLPGESADEYRQGLEATIAELEATTPLQIYLAEKIFDCMWWIRRLEAQKTEAILNKMWYEFKTKLQTPPDRELLANGEWDDPYLVAALNALKQTPESLVVTGMRYSSEFLKNIDARIADRIKAMQGLQSAYESLVNRKLVIERLRLQNENLRRDLKAIEATPVDDGDK